MKNLSKWAKNHPKTARYLIALSHVLVVLNSFWLGALLFISDWGKSTLFLNVAALLFFMAYLLYPKKGTTKGLFRYSYVRQKIQDFTLVFSYALVIALGVNNFFTDENDYTVSPKTATQWMSLNSVPSNEASATPETSREVKKKFREMKKQLRQELRQIKKDLKKQGDKERSELVKVLLIILTLAVSVGLGFLVAALACNIACSGQEGAAWVVLILGIGGIIALMILVITRITRTSASNT